jgi:hypothetical protein
MGFPEYFEDEPEHNGSLHMMLEDVIGVLSYSAPITDYAIQPINVADGEAYTIDIHIQQQDPVHVFLHIKAGDHQPTFGLLVEKLLRLIKYQIQTRDLFEACAN